MEQSFILPKLLSRAGMIAKIGRFMALLSQEKAWRIKIEEAKSTRSTQQCRYLNGVAYKIIGDAIGYERDDVSEFLCGAYWGWKEKRVPKKPSCPNGIESVPVRTTTTDENGHRDVLTWEQFSDYVAYVQRFAASKGIFVPDPDPNYQAAEQQEAA
jgi:hypothetical protein